MQSLVALYNTALARLGGSQLDRVNSPLEETAVTTLCNTLFPHVADMALASAPWSFASKRGFLALKGAGEGRYRHRYALPADCIRPVEIAGEIEDHAPVPFLIEGKDLLTAQAPAVLAYVARQHDVAEWPAYFAEAVSWGLAAELATAVVNDPRRQQFYLQRFQQALADGAAQDLGRQRWHANRAPWLEARG